MITKKGRGKREGGKEKRGKEAVCDFLQSVLCSEEDAFFFTLYILYVQCI